MQDKPDAEPGGVEVRFKQGEAVRAELTVEHFVDDWFKTDFVFCLNDGVASLKSVEGLNGAYWIDQNEPARRKAYDAVESLSVVDEVERINDE